MGISSKLAADLSLTPRRGETLQVLRRLASQRGDGVHYSEVGQEMGISAWTAYALLRELERAGLAARSYAIPPVPPPGSAKRGGRSRILFAPAGWTLPAADLVDRLKHAVERFGAIADERVAARLYLAEALQGPGEDFALHLGYWLARLESAGRSASEAVRGVLESSVAPTAKIQTVAAMGLGTALSRLDRTRLAERVVATVTGLSSLLAEAQHGSDGALAALVEAARGVNARDVRSHRLPQ